MPDEIIIPGGSDEWSGHRWDDFAIGAEHTVFEWCMIYTDRHPTPFLGDHSGTATAEMQDIRLTLLGARGSNKPGWRPHPNETDKAVWDDPGTYRTCNAVYQELAAGIASGRLDAKRVYLDDRPGEIDPTLCIIDAAPVLAIARRRGDYGQYIVRLLTADAVPEGMSSVHRKPRVRPGGAAKIPRDTKAAAVRRHLASKYPNGIPAGVTDKVIALATGASERTVRRVRSGKN
jgi:hypothetical protein